jgi:mRNA interferase MazF
MPEPLRGEVWQVDLGYTGKIRPAIVVSRDDPDAPRALIIYVPVTTKNRGSEYEVELPRGFLDAGSLANVQGVASAEKHRFQKKLGDLSKDSLVKVEQALKFALDL